MKYLVLLVSLALIACSTGNVDTTIEDNSMPVPGTNTGEMIEEVIDDGMMETPDVTFVITGENFAFFMDGEEAPELVVNEGDLVRIEFTSTDGFHDWVVDEFDAATEKVQTDGSTYVEFVASEKGTFEYYCSVGQHRANGMWGNLVVQ